MDLCGLQSEFQEDSQGYMEEILSQREKKKKSQANLIFFLIMSFYTSNARPFKEMSFTEREGMLQIPALQSTTPNGVTYQEAASTGFCTGKRLYCKYPREDRKQ